MLPADQRLTSPASFRATVRRGRRRGGALLVVHLLPGDGPDPIDGVVAPARIGFVVSKAVGNAVTRNRVKRRLRHLVRAELPVLPAGAHVVVRALAPAACATYAELGSELRRCLVGCLDHLSATPSSAASGTERVPTP